MILGKVRCGFFQELVLHPELTSLALEFAEPGPLAHGESGLVADVFPPVGIHPVPESSLVNSELLRDLSDRTRRLDHQLHGLFTELWRIVLLRSCQHIPFQTTPDLIGVAVRKVRGGSVCGMEASAWVASEC